jgi:dGTPase
VSQFGYGIHDLEDIVARRLATRDHWQNALTDAFDSIGGRLDTEEGIIDAAGVASGLFADSWQRKRLVGRLVNLFMAAAKVTESQALEHPLLRFRVGLTGDHDVLLTRLRNMSFRLVIDKAAVQQLERRGKRVVSDIFRVLRESPEQLIPSWSEGTFASTTERHICDYVAGMTDPYAEKVYRRLFVPGVGSSGDEL